MRFFYPNGTSSDFDERIKAEVKSAGYFAAVTAVPSARDHDLYEIARLGVGGDFTEFEKNASGFRLLSNARGKS